MFDTQYHVIYSGPCYLLFHVTTVGIGTYYPWIKGGLLYHPTDCVCCCFPMPPHVPYGLCGLPPDCGRSVTDF
jgi:hypothetical protein